MRGVHGHGAIRHMGPVSMQDGFLGKLLAWR